MEITSKQRITLDNRPQMHPTLADELRAEEACLSLRVLIDTKRSYSLAEAQALCKKADSILRKNDQ